MTPLTFEVVWAQEARLDIQLQRLGPIGFQDLAAALAIKCFGPGVQVMGPGRDGGRDMYYQGDLRMPAELGAPGTLTGYTVFQVKHKSRLAVSPQDNARWLWTEVRKELEAWADPEADRNPLPDTLIFVTNIHLTPVPKSGGHDQLLNSIKQFIERFRDSSRDTGEEAKRIREAKLNRLEKVNQFLFWDANQIAALLRVHSSLRWSFPAFLTPGDVFENLNAFTQSLRLEELGPALKAHARASLTSDGQIYFDEAGSANSAGFPVHEVAIDLPIKFAQGLHHDSAMKYILARAERMLKPEITTIKGPKHIVLTGAPGNGKTTLSKFLVQAFRAAMLEETSSLSQGQSETISGTRKALQRLALDLPKHRRWAMRIDLAEYAEEGGLDDESTLLKWIAHKINRSIDAGEVNPNLLQTWRGEWPWFLVLDGLDEVTEPMTRKRLIRHVTSFAEEAEAHNHDVFIVLTTRPVGYTENISPHLFEQIDLGELSTREALKYASAVTKVRLGPDRDRIQRVERRLKHATEDEALQPLLKTPLQVLILTIIVDSSGRLSTNRFDLFHTYYETVYKREVNKSSTLASLLQEHQAQILRLHEEVGFELQTRSEAGEHAYAALSELELDQIARKVLSEDGFDTVGKDSRLLEQLLAATRQRLVLIVPRGDDGVGFDVRSLQELTAALYLVNGSWPTVLKRLQIAAPSPHWRNTWLFAAGRIITTSQRHQQEELIDLIQTLDTNTPERLGMCVPIGPRLALDVIDDGMARGTPRMWSRIAEHALQVLHEPEPLDMPRIAQILIRFAMGGETQTQLVSDAIRATFENSHFAIETIKKLQELIQPIAKEYSAGVAVRALSTIKASQQGKRPTSNPERWETFELELQTHEAVSSTSAPEDHLKNEQELNYLSDIVRRMSDELLGEHEYIAIIDRLGTHALASALEDALKHVIREEKNLYIQLRDSVLPVRHRIAIGEALR